MNVEASVQVAPALSTYAVEQEFDFYTAVDDISGEAGAGFIGKVTSNRATYYKYLRALLKRLKRGTAARRLPRCCAPFERSFTA